MLSTKHITLLVMGVAAVGLVVWDIIVASNRTSGDTISELTLGFAQRYPVAVFSIGLTLGVILGHLFWPQYPK